MEANHRSCFVSSAYLKQHVSKAFDGTVQVVHTLNDSRTLEFMD